MAILKPERTLGATGIKAPLTHRRKGRQSKVGKRESFWLHDTSVMDWSRHDESILVDYGTPIVNDRCLKTAQASTLR